MDSSQSSSDTQRGIDPAKGCLPSCDRSIEGGRLGGPTPPAGYERDVRVRTPAPSSGAPPRRAPPVRFISSSGLSPWSACSPCISCCKSSCR